MLQRERKIPRFYFWIWTFLDDWGLEVPQRGGGGASGGVANDKPSLYMEQGEASCDPTPPFPVLYAWTIFDIMGNRFK